MNIEEIKLMYEYNYWANRRILSMAEHITSDQLMKSTAFSWGNLHGTLLHTLDTEYGWRVLCQHGNHTPAWEVDEFPDLKSIQTRWDIEQYDMQAYLNSLTDENLQGVISYDIDDGTTRNRVLWHCLFHVVNHGMQHRSECAAMLTDFGQSPGDLDFVVFLNQRQ